MWTTFNRSYDSKSPNALKNFVKHSSTMYLVNLELGTSTGPSPPITLLLYLSSMTAAAHTSSHQPRGRARLPPPCGTAMPGISCSGSRGTTPGLRESASGCRQSAATSRRRLRASERKHAPCQCPWKQLYVVGRGDLWGCCLCFKILNPK